MARTGCLGSLLDLVGETLAVGGAVVDDRDLLRTHVLDGVGTDHRTLLDVVGHDAEGRVEALLRVLGIGRRR
jgi:hypothetical protein